MTPASLIPTAHHVFRTALAARILTKSSFGSPFRSKLYATSFVSFRMASTLPRLPIFEALAKHDLKTPAVVHNPSGRTFTYGELAHDVADSIETLKERAGGKSLSGERVAFLVENGYDYIGMGNIGKKKRLIE
jgi:malonyl-CoA/methylmalonyl-CoA synthetase